MKELDTGSSLIRAFLDWKNAWGKTVLASIFGGLCAFLYLWFYGGPEVAENEVIYIKSAIFACLLGAVLAFVWHLFRAPYRQRDEARKQVETNPPISILDIRELSSLTVPIGIAEVTIPDILAWAGNAFLDRKTRSELCNDMHGFLRRVKIETGLSTSLIAAPEGRSVQLTIEHCLLVDIISCTSTPENKYMFTSRGRSIYRFLSAHEDQLMDEGLITKPKGTWRLLPAFEKLFHPVQLSERSANPDPE